MARHDLWEDFYRRAIAWSRGPRSPSSNSHLGRCRHSLRWFFQLCLDLIKYESWHFGAIRPRQCMTFALLNHFAPPFVSLCVGWVQYLLWVLFQTNFNAPPQTETGTMRHHKQRQAQCVTTNRDRHSMAVWQAYKVVHSSSDAHT